MTKIVREKLVFRIVAAIMLVAGLIAPLIFFAPASAYANTNPVAHILPVPVFELQLQFLEQEFIVDGNEVITHGMPVPANQIWHLAQSPGWEWEFVAGTQTFRASVNQYRVSFQLDPITAEEYHDILVNQAATLRRFYEGYRYTESTRRVSATVWVTVARRGQFPYEVEIPPIEPQVFRPNFFLGNVPFPSGFGNWSWNVPEREQSPWSPNSLLDLVNANVEGVITDPNINRFWAKRSNLTDGYEDSIVQIVVPVTPAEQRIPPPAPRKQSRTMTSITLREGRRSAAGAFCEYRFRRAGTETWSAWDTWWHFDGLEPNTYYEFQQRFRTLPNGNFLASSPSAVFTVRTLRESEEDWWIWAIVTGGIFAAGFGAVAIVIKKRTQKLSEKK
jgi:hypothetical protein